MTANKTLLDAARSATAANKMARSLTTADLELAIKNLQAAAAKIKKAEVAKAARRRLSNIRKLEAIIANMGLTAADVRSIGRTGAAKLSKRSAATTTKRKVSSKKGPKKGTKVAPKYRLKLGKDIHEWTGRGRMPLAFKDHIESGGSLENCLIKKKAIDR